MPKTKYNKSKNQRKNKKIQQKKRSVRCIKGGMTSENNSVIQNYALNSYNTDPNYMQIASRNVVQHGSGKSNKNRIRMNKTKKNKNAGGASGAGGSMMEFAANQLSNPISNFPSYNSTQWLVGNYSQNSAPYIQPLGNQYYTGTKI
jgi:hypothetical protein